MDLTIKQLTDKINLLHQQMIKAQESGNEKLTFTFLKRHRYFENLRYQLLKKGELNGAI